MIKTFILRNNNNSKKLNKNESFGIVHLSQTFQNQNDVNQLFEKTLTQVKKFKFLIYFRRKRPHKFQDCLI